MSLRCRLATVLDRLGAFDRALVARSRLDLPILTVLTYHRVGRAWAAGDIDRGVIDASPDEFDAQMRTLRERFSTIGLDDLERHVALGDPLPPNPALVTFDDGYRECLTGALPVLRRHGLRAVFFVASGFPGRGRIFWWDRIALTLRRTRRRRIVLDYPSPIDLDLSTGTSACLLATTALQRVVKSTTSIDVDRFVEHLARAADVALPAREERELATRLLLSWDDIRTLRSAGMDIASHTRTHRVLQTVPLGELDHELLGARLDIEAQIDEPTRAIAYPVGRRIAGDVAIGAAVRRAGYRLGFSNATGLSLLGFGVDPLDLRRLAVDRSMPLPYMRAAMTIPYLAYRAGDAHSSAAMA